MHKVSPADLKKLYIPPDNSHKGQNGRLLIIGGSHLFHAASLWALQVASRIVDLVHYSSVNENNELVMRLKSEFRNGIVVPREAIEEYIEEDDCVLIGPGMVRKEISNIKYQISNRKIKNQKLEEILKITNEGELTESLTNYLLAKYPEKKWVIDAGALQMVDVNLIPKNAVLTPHKGEFEGLINKVKSEKLKVKSTSQKLKVLSESNISIEDKVKILAKELKCTILLKGPTDIVCSGGECREDVCVPGESFEITGGNAGMTKGGTGDVLSGLIAALACKNDPVLSTIAGSYINKKAGDELYEKVGLYFNTTDLANEIPRIMQKLAI